MTAHTAIGKHKSVSTMSPPFGPFTITFSYIFSAVSNRLMIPLPLDESDKLLLQLTLSPGLLEILQAAKVEDDVAGLAKVNLSNPRVSICFVHG